MMNLQELQTIATNKLNVKIIILNNGGYHSIKQTQNNIFNARTKGYCGADASSGLDFPNFEMIAKAFGFDYIVVQNVNNLNERISEFLSSKNNIIAEFFVDPEQDFEPKLISKLLDDGKFFTPTLEDMYPFLDEDELISNKYKV